MAFHPVDVRVGQLIRARRKILGLTQSDVAKAAGCQFQQMQKYETGANRVSCSRLVDIAKVLNVKPSYFFDEDDRVAANANALIAAMDDSGSRVGKLVRSFAQLDDKMQASVLNMVQTMAKADD